MNLKFFDPEEDFNNEDEGNDHQAEDDGDYGEGFKEPDVKATD